MPKEILRRIINPISKKIKEEKDALKDKSKIKDPKDIITAHAFQLDPSLLGVPLASPRKRAWAILFDIFFIFIIGKLLGSFIGVLIGIIVFKFIQKQKAESIFGRFMRFTGASLAGIMIFAFTVSTSEELIDKLETYFNNTEDITVNINDEIPVQSILNPKEDLPAHKIDTLKSLNAFIAAKQNSDLALQDSLKPVLEEIFASTDTQELKKQNEDLRETIATLKEENNELDNSISKAGLLSFLKNTIDAMGLSLGWFGLYFIAANVFWKGQTPGKKIMKIQVIRLNAKPINLWFSFERFGGYAAGLATGLFGFFQIYWDKNRQAIHDKIAGTVVIDLAKTKKMEFPDVPVQMSILE